MKSKVGQCLAWQQFFRKRSGSSNEVQEEQNSPKPRWCEQGSMWARLRRGRREQPAASSLPMGLSSSQGRSTEPGPSSLPLLRHSPGSVLQLLTNWSLSAALDRSPN